MIKRWHIISAKNAMKSALPFQDALRRIKRKMVKYQGNIDLTKIALEQGLNIVSDLRKRGIKPSGTILEIGTGWTPIIPLTFFVASKCQLILTDMEKLLDESTIADTKHFALENSSLISDRLGVDVSDVEQRIMSFDFEYRCPPAMDAIPDHSVDIIYSRAVFEHISPGTLERVLQECRRLLSHDGAMAHIIDNSDHWEHKDPSISRINFLTIGDATWKLATINPQDYQNRLRHSDYEKIFSRAGFVEVESYKHVDEAALRDAKSLRILDRYKTYAADDLAALTSFFYLKKASS